MPHSTASRPRVKAYAFDAYGTLFDVHSAIARHRPAMGAEAEAFSALWRAKQLEYSWTRSLMQRYADFWTLTQEALDFALARHPAIPCGLRQPLLEAYEQLSAFADVMPALRRLAAAELRLCIFTNGTKAMATSAAVSAGIAPAFEAIVTVDEIRSFKTDPAAYALLHEALGLALGEVALVSSNRWDVAGAAAFGMPAYWINRAGAPDEYLDLSPVAELKSLGDLPT